MEIGHTAVVVRARTQQLSGQNPGFHSFDKSARCPAGDGSENTGSGKITDLLTATLNSMLLK